MDISRDSARFVIIGGSYAGIKTAHGVLKQIPNAHVTLINPSMQFFYNIASPRILANPDAIRTDEYMIDIPSCFARHGPGSFRFVEGLATEVLEQTRVVKLADCEEIAYDYLIIASGSTTKSTEGLDGDMAPWKARQDGRTLEYIIESQEKLARATDIVICGAGPVGVEFAGELADMVEESEKNCSVTLISSRSTILPHIDQRVGLHAMAILARKGVKVVMGSKVASAYRDNLSSRWIIELDDGTTMSSDCYISTTGPLPCNNFIPGHFLDDQGWMKVDAHLRVVSSAASDQSPCRVYGIGDIIACQPRNVRVINQQLTVLLATLKADLQTTTCGQKSSLTYSPRPTTHILIPIGAAAGTGLVFGVIPWEWVVWLMQGRNYLVPYVRRFLSS
ncbi:FAD/NAD(P)-binding domain-containing protein [Aureobasidium namibiae CBS 147.97]|uniref:FAD/NAD(P)-binding domain-containing protein n=1 Tax=Aureobasidium namibiae CBS 147.97 TaxID=1043004 RepID=A0A074X0G6_9PEZI